MRGAVALLSWLVVGAAAAPLAQSLPAEPVAFFDGRVRVSGEAGVTAGAPDHEAYFNYTDYERNALRTLRLALAAVWQPAARFALVGEVRSEDLETPGAYAAYVRVRPWTSRRIDIQAGRIPPVFGAFGRRSYSADRILIGYPLAYQYLTSLRADAVPAHADDLLVMRGRGWRSNFPIGSTRHAPGVPLVSAFRWDTGIQARWAGDRHEAALSVTTGTLSRPRVSDDNGSKQLSARVMTMPIPGLVAGASAARGGWLANSVPTTAGTGRFTQTALGADLEYSRDYWIVRGELVWSRWRLPFVATPREGDAVDALGAWIEARYRLTPRWYLAGRADRLAFSEISGTFFAARPTSWDAPVVRYEAGGGYYLLRNLVARSTVQLNRRDGGRVRSRTFVSAQLAYWF